MNITVITPPEPVVTLDEVAMHLRMGSDEILELDLLMAGYIEAATTFVEQATNRSLGIQTLLLTGPAFRNLELYRPPFREIVSIEYWNDLEELSPLEVSDFFVVEGLVPRLAAYSRVVDQCSNLARREDSVRVVYKTGYDSVPKGLKAAVLLQVQLLADRFDTNEKADLERTRDAILSPFRVMNFHAS